MIPGDDGKPMEVRKGTNGFTCMPDTNPNSDRLEPMCMNQATAQWFTSFKNNAPKPSNTVPGIAYMAKGGEGLDQGWEAAAKARRRGCSRGLSATLDDLLAVRSQRERHSVLHSPARAGSTTWQRLHHPRRFAVRRPANLPDPRNRAGKAIGFRWEDLHTRQDISAPHTACRLINGPSDPCTFVLATRHEEQS